MSIGKVDVRKGLRESAENIQHPVDIQDVADDAKAALATTTTDTIIAAASALRSTNDVSSDIDVSKYNHLLVFLSVTAVGGDADETLDLVVQSKDPVSASYVTIATFTQCTQPQGAQVRFESIGPDTPNNEVIGVTIRLSWTVGGTTPTFTFSITVIGKSGS